MRLYRHTFYKKINPNGDPCQLTYVGEGFLFCALNRFCDGKNVNGCRHGDTPRVELGPGSGNPGPEIRGAASRSKPFSSSFREQLSGLS